MVRHIVFRIFAGLVLLAVVAGIAFFAFQAGVAHGIALNIPNTSSGAAASPYLYPWMPFGYFGWFPGFGFFGLLIPIFLLFLVFGSVRRIIWGPRMGWRHMDGEKMTHGPWGEGVPPMFNEWHRRAHASQTGEQPSDKKSDQ